MPATTSTAMKPRTIASATASQRRSASGRDRVGMAVVIVRRVGGVRVRCHKRVTKSGRPLYSQRHRRPRSSRKRRRQASSMTCPPQPRSCPARARAPGVPGRGPADPGLAHGGASSGLCGAASASGRTAARPPRRTRRATAGIAAGSMIGRGWLLGLILLGAGLVDGRGRRPLCRRPRRSALFTVHFTFKLIAAAGRAAAHQAPHDQARAEKSSSACFVLLAAHADRVRDHGLGRAQRRVPADRASSSSTVDRLPGTFDFNKAVVYLVLADGADVLSR